MAPASRPVTGFCRAHVMAARRPALGRSTARAVAPRPLWRRPAPCPTAVGTPPACARPGPRNQGHTRLPARRGRLLRSLADTVLELRESTAERHHRRVATRNLLQSPDHPGGLLQDTNDELIK